MKKILFALLFVLFALSTSLIAQPNVVLATAGNPWGLEGVGFRLSPVNASKCQVVLYIANVGDQTVSGGGLEGFFNVHVTKVGTSFVDSVEETELYWASDCLPNTSCSDQYPVYGSLPPNRFDTYLADMTTDGEGTYAVRIDINYHGTVPEVGPARNDNTYFFGFDYTAFDFNGMTLYDAVPNSGAVTVQAKNAIKTAIRKGN